jgi:hypothetical protein
MSAVYVLPALSLFLAVLFGLEPDWSQVAEHVPGTARGAAVPGTAGADKCPPRFKSSWSVPARLRLAEYELDKGGRGCIISWVPSEISHTNTSCLPVAGL